MPTSNTYDIVQSAVLDTLGSHLSKHNARLALTIWEQRYAAKQLHGVASFLKDIAPLLEQSKANMQALRMDLYRSLAGINGQKNDADPTIPAQAAASLGSDDNVSLRMLKKRGNNATPDIQVFTAICENLIEGAQKSGFREFGEFKLALTEHLGSAKLASKVSEMLLNWVSHESELINGIIPRDRLAQIVNIFYISLCEAVGPVTGDAILNNAVTQADSLPAAKQFSPRQLL